MLVPRYVDTREAPERLRPLERGGFTPKALATGDVQFPEAGGEPVLIENKKVGQVLEDLGTGQLMRQMRRMVEESPYATLLIEGRWAQIDGKLLGTRWDWCAVWNELQSIQDLGVRIQFSTGPEHTVQRVFELADYYAKGIHHSAQRVLAGDRRLAVLGMVDGVGKEYGGKLLTHFGTLRGVANATREEIEALDGFGPVRARRITEFWQHGNAG